MAIAEPELTPTDVLAPDANGDATQADKSGLVLDSLEIKNFRAFRHLVVPRLGRVNLITGKNNVGKSSLLEAIWLYANQGAPSVLRQLLTTREELSWERPAPFVSGSRIGQSTNDSRTRSIAFAIKSIFSDYPSLNNLPVSVSIGRNLQQSAMHFILRGDAAKDRPDSRTEGLASLLKRSTYNDLFITIAEDQGSDERLQEVQSYALSMIDGDSLERDRTDNSKFIRSTSLSSSELNQLWNGINLTDLEAEVTGQLRIVHNNIQQIAFRSRNNGVGSTPFVRLRSESEPIPLRSLGEGTNRLFAIALCLVNCQNGTTLVDEIENGLHYSVLLDVWRLIFQTARRLNVQVFATTHSWDCIEAFQQAAAEDDDPESGVLVRLQNTDGDVTATVFDERRLAIVTREGIEVR